MAKNRKEPGSSRLAPPHVDGVNNERVQRLLDALARSRQKMQPFREQRRTLVRQFVGQSYGDAVARQKTPLNLMRLATTIYRRQVAARSPQALVVPMDPSMAPVADDYELVLNSRLRKMKFEDSLREVTTHSMFGPGIMKIGLAPSGKEFETQLGTRKDPGKVFADCVDLDDAVWDMRAASWDRVQFFGDSYEMTIDALEAMGIKDVTPIQSAMTNNEQGDERVTALTAGDDAGERGYVDVARMWDVWCPIDNCIVMVVAGPDGGFSSGRVVKVIPWKGPQHGPYHVLSFESPPSNLMPISPVSTLADLHSLMNKVFNKITNQVERQKTVGVYQGGGEADAKNVRDAKDGEIIRGEGEVSEHRYGGADGPSLAFLMQAKDLSSYFGGNLDALGGLSRQANTVGQESMIARASNMQIADMQETAMRFTTGAVSAIGMWVWGDPVTVDRVKKKVPGTDWEFMHEVTPDMREGEIEDYEVSVAPYSMQSLTPSERVARLTELMTTQIIPISASLAAQGKKVDYDGYFGIIADYSTMPEIKQIIVDMTPEEKRAMQGQAGGAPSGERPLQSPVTTRKQVRESVSGTGSGGQAKEYAAMAAMSAPGGGK